MTQRNADGMRALLTGMRDAFDQGGNAMAWAREHLGRTGNDKEATMIAYDLQAGKEVLLTCADSKAHTAHCQHIVEALTPWLSPGDSLLEVGVGESTSLSEVLKALDGLHLDPFGFDISWSRLKVGQKLLKERAQQANLFLADLFAIPFQDNAIDVVYTYHSIEPNGGLEEAALMECLRVARKTVVLIEPIYELGSPAAQERMREQGYVRNLKATAESLGAQIADYRLVPQLRSELNPTGFLVLTKSETAQQRLEASTMWRCPLTHAPLSFEGEIIYAKDVGVAYPRLCDIPLLRAEHSIVAQQLMRLLEID